MKPIYHYIFHFNSFTGQWACVDREAYNDYLNGSVSYEYVTYASSIETLLTLFNDGPKENPTQEKES